MDRFDMGLELKLKLCVCVGVVVELWLGCRVVRSIFFFCAFCASFWFLVEFRSTLFSVFSRFINAWKVALCKIDVWYGENGKNCNEWKEKMEVGEEKIKDSFVLFVLE